ncbi:MAG: class I SAM-dependent methyltransferase [Candidatus Limnocylindrales bacterium]
MRLRGRQNRVTGTEKSPETEEGGRRGKRRGPGRLLSGVLVVLTLAIFTERGRHATRSAARWLDARVEGFSEPESRTYSRFFAPVFGRLYRGVATDVVAELQARGGTGKATIVDLGCGPGDLALELSHRLRNARVVGLDLSPSMMQLASRHATTDGRLRFIVGDAEAMPFTDASVDLVVSTLSLHHWKDPAAVFGEVSRVLRPGGVALIYDLSILSLRPLELEVIARDLGLDPGELRRERVKGGFGARLFARFRLEGPAVGDYREN